MASDAGWQSKKERERGQKTVERKSLADNQTKTRDFFLPSFGGGGGFTHIFCVGAVQVVPEDTIFENHFSSSRTGRDDTRKIRIDVVP